jgi:hypothetical protein
MSVQTATDMRLDRMAEEMLSLFKELLDIVKDTDQYKHEYVLDLHSAAMHLITAKELLDR